MGWLIHAFANQQHLLSETFYFKAADALWDILWPGESRYPRLDSEPIAQKLFAELN